MAHQLDPHGDAPFVGIEVRAVKGGRVAWEGLLTPRKKKKPGDLLGVIGEVLGDHLGRRRQDLVLAEDADEGREHGLARTRDGCRPRGSVCR